MGLEVGVESQGSEWGNCEVHWLDTGNHFMTNCQSSLACIAGGAQCFHPVCRCCCQMVAIVVHCGDLLVAPSAEMRCVAASRKCSNDVVTHGDRSSSSTDDC